MTQQETLKQVAEQTGLTVATVKGVFEAYAEVTKETLSSDKTEKIPLPGIGTLKVRHSNARVGHNPKTGEAVEIAAQDKPILANFKAGELYKALN